MKAILCTILIAFVSVTAFAQPAKIVTVAQIAAYAKTIDRMTDRRKEPDVVIADVSDYETDVPEWKKFKSTKELEAFREKTETYTIAYNWKDKAKIVASAFTIFSPSGDWAQYVNHYFRPDGSAAKVTTEMRTFNGDYIIIREKYFDARGKVLKKTAKFLDLMTKKPKKPTEEMLDEDSEFYKTDFYTRLSALPFYSLIKTK
jgi:hypothetical protein